jgi:hypothetical protein
MEGWLKVTSTYDYDASPFTCNLVAGVLDFFLHPTRDLIQLWWSRWKEERLRTLHLYGQAIIAANIDKQVWGPAL